MMTKKMLMLLAAVAALGLGACAKQYKPGELAAGIDIGGLYYTQFSLFQEKNRYRTTNYRRGFLIPINTPATLLAIDSKRIELKLNNGQLLTVENVPKHTNEDTQAALKKILGKRRVALEQFTDSEQKQILQGKVANGMSRKAVLAAIGYPPQNSTPTLDSDQWTYWSNRYDRFVVHFKGDKVAEIVN